MKNKIIYLLLISLALTGCFEETPKKEEVHTVAWFLEHQDVMNTTLEKCSNNPGELLQTPNCINAIEARRTITDRQLSRGLDTFTPSSAWKK